ncbi:DUF2877 domain-containing protein [Candidatus Pantoea multigeneris]|uniref:DUF2877 domain-containing protein n=1 Tax=Candidatus Pantoea multigeneris TaxID=2608357 RepID=A0ABX0RCF9_9GAMM|nr:DUF2877 domain-containing protein [Pantoea multigeneris]
MFRRAVNLYQPQQQQLFTLLSQEYDNGPNSCRIATTHFNTLFRPGETVAFSPHGIAIGTDKWIDYTHCAIWHPPVISITREELNTVCWRSWQQLINSEIRYSNSLFKYRGDNLFHQQLATLLQQGRQAIITSIKNNLDPTPAMRSLIGLGIGLTPSGDDWLCGFSMIFFLPGHPGEKYRPFLIDALASGKPKTTLLSAITLEHHLQHRYREHVGEFITTLLSNNRQAIKPAIQKIKEIGSSSGCDMLCGIADACALTAEIGEHYVRQDSD